MAEPPLFPQPNGAAHKWWVLELRFERPLKKKEIRLLSDVFRAAEYPSQRHVGVDGAVLGQWYNSFPGGGDAAVVLDAVRAVGASAQVRAAPYGRDCPTHPGCIADLDEPLPEVGSVACSCDPCFSEADWLRVSAAGEPEGYRACPACRDARRPGAYTNCRSCDSSGWRPGPPPSPRNRP